MDEWANGRTRWERDPYTEKSLKKAEKCGKNTQKKLKSNHILCNDQAIV